MDNMSVQTTQPTDARMSVTAVREQIAAIQELMKGAMKMDQHYGVIPGTSGKPVLLKPGAEKICMMFRLIPAFTVDKSDLPNGHREYEVTCTLVHGPTGMTAGQGMGSASTMESKHRYRGAGGKACPECGALACKPSKKEYGGGYYCEAKGGGCGKKWGPKTEECQALDLLPGIKTENPDPADQFNTVLKMAQKRALVAAVLVATAASDIFTQDLEDMKANADVHAPRADEAPKPPVAMPTEKKDTPAPKPADTPPQESSGSPLEEGQREVTGIIARVSVKEDSNARGPYTKYGIKIGDTWYNTFDTKLGSAAQALEGCKARVVYTTKGQFHDAVIVTPAE